VALFNSKNYDLALKEFEESIKYGPRCPQFHMSKAKCLLQLTRKAEAIESLSRCLELDEKQVEASQMLAQLRESE
jgi:tetratricopeptide (TPR) repeat protein